MLEGCEVWVMACPEHGTVLAALCAQCAQSVNKVCTKTCTKCAQRTSVHTLSQECTIKMIKHQMCTKTIKMLVETIIYGFSCTLLSFQLVGRRKLRGWSEGQSMAHELM